MVSAETGKAKLAKSRVRLQPVNISPGPRALVFIQNHQQGLETMAENTSSSPFAGLIQQNIAVIPSFTLESGVEVKNVPVAFKTWGKLNEAKDNCLVICHALTGSADVEDWFVVYPLERTWCRLR